MCFYWGLPCDDLSSQWSLWQTKSQILVWEGGESIWSFRYSLKKSGFVTFEVMPKEWMLHHAEHQSQWPPQGTFVQPLVSICYLSESPQICTRFYWCRRIKERKWKRNRDRILMDTRASRFPPFLTFHLLSLSINSPFPSLTCSDPPITFLMQWHITHLRAGCLLQQCAVVATATVGGGIFQTMLFVILERQFPVSEPWREKNFSLHWCLLQLLHLPCH